MDYERNVQLTDTGKKWPELRQVQISAAYVRANHDHRHVKVLDRALGFICRRLRILQRDRCRAEVT